MTTFDPQRHHRRSIRLKGYDYSQEGAYFVTIVTWQRECLLGQIVDREMNLSPYGEIVQKWWEEIPVHFPNVETGAFVIMPNHVHGIIYILDERRGTVPVPEENDGIQIPEPPVPEENGGIQIPEPPVPKENGGIQIPEPPVPKDDGKNLVSKNNDMSGAILGGETPPLQEFNGTPTLGQIVAYFKYQSTKEMNKVETAGVVTKFWQRNYYEHIIRNDKDLQNKTDYIEANPLLWEQDHENPVNITT